MALPRTLFVYGTLRPSARSDMGRGERVRLAAGTLSVRPATTAGVLYDLGAYPGLVAAADRGPRVAGEVLELADPAQTFAWLDLYEDADPARPATNLYVRETAEVLVEGGEIVDAWVYRYVGTLAGAGVIASGRWLD